MAKSSQALSQGRVLRSGLLIFVSLGTHEQPFERVLDLLEPLAGTEAFFVQYGSTPPRPHLVGFSWVPLVAYEVLLGHLRSAAAVVCHGGVGTIITALGAGRKPVVIPRLHRFGEHVDDHQVEITTALEQRGLVVAYGEGDDLAKLIAAARRSGKVQFESGSSLKDAVAEAVRG